MNNSVTNHRRRNSLYIKNRRNKTVLGIFLIIALSALFARIVVGGLLDAGYVNGKFHIGFWINPQEAFNKEFQSWENSYRTTNNSWENFLNARPEIRTIIKQHPNFLWFSTQFTWLTTIIIIFFLAFRFFKYEDRVPKWLRWIMTQRTLSLVTMYDLVVGIVFWASMFKGWEENFTGGIFVAELLITITVHAIIPCCIFTYSMIYLIKDSRASILKEFFPLKGLIFPAIYTAYYIFLTIVWDDPYSITNMHDKLTTNSNGNIINGEGNWHAWSKQLWMIFAVLFLIYILLNLMTLIHNIILIKLNKKYNPEKDYEILQKRKIKDEKLKRKMLRLEHKKDILKH